MKVRVIGNSNGVGLSRDLQLMANVLSQCGCEVQTVVVDVAGARRRRSRLAQWQARLQLLLRKLRGHRSARPQVINIMMEHVWTQHLPDADLNVVVPNPEWFDRHDMRMLRHADRIWAKTANTRSIFAGLQRPTTLIGFDSEDRHEAGINRERSFFHLAGKSVMKGTDRLLKLWQAHPDWPTLLVVQHEAPPAAQHAGNIEFRTGHLDDAELRRLQNSSLFHVCTSETEGWGHYLVEAMSVGAVTITLDAPPMNELVTPQHGYLLSCTAGRRQKLAQCYEFDAGALSDAVGSLMAMSTAEVESLGVAARKWFIDNKTGFGARIEHALENLNV